MELIIFGGLTLFFGVGFLVFGWMTLGCLGFLG